MMKKKERISRRGDALLEGKEDALVGIAGW